MAYKRLGDMLLNAGVISQEQLEEALSIQKETKMRLGSLLISRGFITEQQLIDVLQMQLGIEFVNLSKVTIPIELASAFSKNLAKKHCILPVKATKDTIFIAMSDPMNFVAIEEVKTATRKRVVPMISTQDAIERAIAALYGNEGASRAIEEMRRESRDTVSISSSSFSSTALDDDALAPTVRLVNSIIERAITERASDIHLEPAEGDMRVRMRIDGVLRNILTVPKELQAAVVSRLKIMGQMDTTERRVPQDGRANVSNSTSDIDLRMSSLPSIFGEKFVIRLLDKNAQQQDAKSIGLSDDEYDKFKRLLQYKSGVVLIVGPTGSGKSSTMYTMIRELNSEEVNLITLEDPVEFHIDGITQVQINEKVGLTFASGLRSILRQDPDIIAVGEIRDGETAEIAMRAAMTGHLVLSTIHTNSAASALDRLLDIGVEPYLISSSLRGILSQRLVRKVCPNCKTEYTPTPAEVKALGLSNDQDYTFYRGEGCHRCFYTGYRGRTGVFEILPIDNKLRNAVSAGENREEIRRVIDKSDFIPMADNCRQLVLSGVTSFEEASGTMNSSDI